MTSSFVTKNYIEAFMFFFFFFFFNVRWLIFVVVTVLCDFHSCETGQMIIWNCKCRYMYKLIKPNENIIKNYNRQAHSSVCKSHCCSMCSISDVALQPWNANSKNNSSTTFFLHSLSSSSSSYFSLHLCTLSVFNMQYIKEKVAKCNWFHWGNVRSKKTAVTICFGVPGECALFLILISLVYDLKLFCNPDPID